MRPVAATILLAAAVLLGACGETPTSAPVVEVVRPAPVHMGVYAQGALKASQSTPLQVPGERWTSLRIVWLAPDGGEVHKGDVVARFSADQSKQDLAQAELDLKRNTIARLGKQAELGQTRGKLDVDLANVAWQLAIADRYASASLDALSRNEVLDAVQDREYLSTRQDVLEWRKGKSTERGTAELAVLGAKRNTLEVQAQQKRKELEALELKAPHDGIFMLTQDWSGEKPHIGSSMSGGRPLAALPDISAMEVLIAVPQVQAQGIEVGDKVVMHPLGQPQQTAASTISWIAAAAQTRSRESPVKYIMMKAVVPAEAISAHHWMPEQQFAVEITVFASDKAISVPNLAIDSSGSTPRVFVLDGDHPVAREVTMGERGSSRTQITDGLQPGDRVLLDYKESTS